MSLEALGDVATTSRSGDVSLEEGKSRTSRHNPVADSAVDLWKTLRNWLDSVELHEIDASRTSFVINVPEGFTGKLVANFHSASTHHEARDALNEAESVVGRKSATLKPHLDRVFDRNSQQAMVSIITRMSLEPSSPRSEIELLELLRNKAIGPEVLEQVLAYLLGWVKQETDAAITNGKPAAVDQSAFAVELLAVARKLDRATILASFGAVPDSDTLEAHLRASVYVQQLDLIAEEIDGKLQAVSDFLRAEADRIEWAQRGFVHETAYEDLEADLTNVWTANRTKVTIAHSRKSEVSQGRLIYADCRLHRARLQGIDTPEHFARGSFHALADALQIGWHPRFVRLLSEDQGS